MSGLYGKYIVSLDPKGRLAIPAKHRNAFPEKQRDKITLTRGIDSCITGYYFEKWQNFKQKIDNMQLNYKEKITLRREFVGRAVEAVFDKQGRVTIPSDLLKLAHLENCSEALIMGCDGYIEIWNPQDYEDSCRDSEEIVQKVMSENYFD